MSEFGIGDTHPRDIKVSALGRAYRTATPSHQIIGMPHLRATPIRRKVSRVKRRVGGTLSFLYHHPEVRQVAKDVAGLALTYYALKKLPNLRYRTMNTLRRWRVGKAARTMHPVFSSATVKRFIKRRAL